MCTEEFAKELDKSVFPGIQGGPLMHVIAAKAVAFKEALEPEFREYQAQIVANAKRLAAGLEALARGNPGFLVVPEGDQPKAGTAPTDLPAGFGRFRRGKRGDR